jgi:hypothetical protein
MAQPGYYLYRYAPPSLAGEGPIEGLSTREITRTVREAGLRPIARPRRVGPNYIVSSVDRHGVVKRVVIDAEMGEIVTIRAASGPIGAADRFDRPSPRAAAAGAVAMHGPDAEMPAAARVAPARKRETARVPVPMPVPRSAVAVLPKEPDTESLPQAGSTVPEPAPRSAAVTPAKPPLSGKRPAGAAAEPAVVKPAEAREIKPAAPVRVVLPGGPELQGEAAAGKPDAKPGAKSDAAAKAAAQAEDSTLKIVPPQSYE